jgi:hypothetical protein
MRVRSKRSPANLPSRSLRRVAVRCRSARRARWTTRSGPAAARRDRDADQRPDSERRTDGFSRSRSSSSRCGLSVVGPRGEPAQLADRRPNRALIDCWLSTTIEDSSRTVRCGCGRVVRILGSCARILGRLGCRWRRAARRWCRCGPGGPPGSPRSVACRPRTTVGRSFWIYSTARDDCRSSTSSSSPVGSSRRADRWGCAC